MAKKTNEMTSDDLMTLPDDIEGIVLDVQGRQKQNAAPVQRPQEEPVAEPTPRVNTEHKPTPTAMPKEGNEDIVTALKACDINRMSATDTINAILRSFIILNKQELRECIKQHDSLI